MDRPKAGELTSKAAMPGSARGVRRKIAVAMSGGVDSAVAAALLIEQGHDVFGLTMVTGPEETGQETASAAREVGVRLGIPHLVVDLRAEFRDRVVRSFVEGYAAGLTPNPCVLCNAAMKFGLLMSRALGLGAELFATGHYADLREVSPAEVVLPAGGAPRTISGEGAGFSAGRILLLRRTGGAKDQTYALCLLTQDKLRRCLFPLHGLTKAEVRAAARRRGLADVVLPESQDVCFLRGRDYRDFVARAVALPVAPGPIVDTAGTVLGRHRGLVGFTVGQRRGLVLGGPEVYYVLEIRPDTNELVVGQQDELLQSSLVADRAVFAAFARLEGPLQVEAAIRYRHRPSPAVITPLAGESLAVDFRTPQRAVAPGQAIAFYLRDWLIGGAWIARRA